MSKKIARKANALLEFLKTTDPAEFISEEVIIANLPAYFKATPTTTGTTLDRSIHACAKYINKQGEYIIANNNKRGFKIANPEEAKEYVTKLFKKHANGFKNAHALAKNMKLHGTYDLFQQQFINMYLDLE